MWNCKIEKNEKMRFLTLKTIFCLRDFLCKTQRRKTDKKKQRGGGPLFISFEKMVLSVRKPLSFKFGLGLKINVSGMNIFYFWDTQFNKANGQEYVRFCGAEKFKLSEGTTITTIEHENGCQ